ncbi:hypothetical protein N3K66_005786 [Trichothecium roseum]|uniref:Uncharacterized protein n=1 Tax=Trichothecium roseum TaxID=47278 RepID=A0ACC0V0M8_9HYPO|nr:hypothetical protein N3K66_005786 [Trichothecium roseum]
MERLISPQDLFIAHHHILLPYSDDDTRWQAVRTRDAAADGHFVYAVRTTRVCCRPTCKARLARRANVSFYPSAAEACGAGFRACKRCRPEAGGLMPEEEAVRKIRAFVLLEGGGSGSSSSSGGDGGGSDVGRVNAMSLGQMARRSGLSKWHFHRVFKAVVGMTPVEFVRMNRRRGAAETSGESSAENATKPGSGEGELALAEDVDAHMPVDPTLSSSSWTDLLVWPDDDEAQSLDTLSAWLNAQDQNEKAADEMCVLLNGTGAG